VGELTDSEWFNANPQRQARIRLPGKELFRDKQRAVRYLDEFEIQYRALGVHDAKQRRVLVWRLPSDNEFYDPEKPQLIPIPFLAKLGEEIEDTDEVLLPLLAELMGANSGA